MDNNKDLKKKVLIDTWGIFVYQLVMVLIYSIFAYMTITHDKPSYDPERIYVFSQFFALIFILIPIIFFQINPMIICLISAIDTTNSLKKSKKVNGLYYIVNCIFQILFLFQIWYNRLDIRICNIFTIFALIGLYMSYRSFQE